MAAETTPSSSSSTDANVVEGPLSDQRFVLTGTLTSMSRDDATAKIAAAGGTILNTVGVKGLKR